MVTKLHFNYAQLRRLLFLSLLVGLAYLGLGARLIVSPNPEGFRNGGVGGGNRGAVERAPTTCQMKNSCSAARQIKTGHGKSITI
jgi:hypothetical protein